MVRGKNKEQFEKFLVNEIYYENEYHNKEDALSHFYTLKESMQIGVYLAYYDSLGYHINIESYLGGGQNVFYPEIIWRMDNHVDTFWKPKHDNLIEYLCFIDRNEAYQEAFKKADELINKQLN